MKKFVFVALLSFFLILPPFPISAALPENDLDSEFSLDTIVIQYADETYVEFYPDPSIGLQFGSLYNFFFNYSQLDTPLNRTFGFIFTINLNLSSQSDIYYLQNLTSELGLQFRMSCLGLFDVNSGLDVPFTDVLDLTPFSYSGSYDSFSFLYDTSEIVLRSGPVSDTVNRDLYFSKLEAVPPGEYIIGFAAEISDIRSFNLAFSLIVDNYSSGSSRPGSSGNPNEDYINGLISFDEAVDEIFDDMNFVLSDPNSTDLEKQLSVFLAQLDLDKLRIDSDEKYSPVVDSFFAKSNRYIHDLSTGARQLSQIADLILNLNMDFADALTSATSPEQGILINSQYSTVLQQMKNVFDVQYKAELDNVLSYSDMADKQESYARLDELFELESSVITLFEESDIDSYLTFSSWILQFEDDPTVYRSIFEFLFSDPRSNVIQPYLIIPFSLVLVSVILGTSSFILRERKNG